jgi:hypothetical protein
LSDDTGALDLWSQGAAPAGRVRGRLAGPAVALAIAVGLVAGAQALSAQPRGGTLALSLLLGAAFGFALQRSRFCFLCLWRDLLDRGDPRGALGVLAALAVGIVGYTLVFGVFLPDPAGPRLPPQAHIGPVSPVLVLGGLLFGAGMAISGSCISAHLYRLGEGSPTAPFALLGTALGFGLGFLAWNPLYLTWLADAPVPWLPRGLGYGGAMVLGLGVLAALALPLLRRLPPEPRPARSGPPDVLRLVFVERWPAWAGGLAVGAIAVAAYLRIAPLGVTAEIGSRTRQAAGALDLLPGRLEGLDTLRGCATAVRDAVLTPNGLFVVGLVAAAFAAALVAGQFKPTRPDAGHVARGLIGGTLLGFGAMIGLGCSIGTFLSGVMAGALSGWVFGIAMLAGVTGTLVVGRRLGVLA